MPQAEDSTSRFMRFFSETYTLFHRRRQSQGVSLTPEGRALLLHLAWTGPMTIGELARHAERAQSVVSDSVSVLESHEMLARVRDPRDNRRTLVWLTERARTWLAEEQQPLERERLDAVLSAMEPTECERFIAAFEGFITVAEQTRRASAGTSPTNGISSADEVTTPKTKGKKGKKP